MFVSQQRPGAHSGLALSHAWPWPSFGTHCPVGSQWLVCVLQNEFAGHSRFDEQGWQVPVDPVASTQRPEMQSESTLHCLLVPHFGQSGPPQFTSVSLPSFVVSVQWFGTHWCATHGWPVHCVSLLHSTQWPWPSQKWPWLSLHESFKGAFCGGSGWPLWQLVSTHAVPLSGGS